MERKRFSLEVQLNNGDPCPKHEHRAWEFQNFDFDTIEECREFLTKNPPDGHRLYDNGNLIEDDITLHFPDSGFGEEKDWH